MRVVDASDRVRTIRRVGSGAIAIALLAAIPWIGWWTLGLLALSAVDFAVVERLVRTSSRPELVSWWGVALTLALLAVGVALSGGPRSPALAWMVIPTGLVAARFRPQVVLAAALATAVAILLATLAAHPQSTVHYPVYVIATLALLVAVTAIVWALQGAELHHRDEAILDPLTGLLNRYALAPRFLEISQQALVTGQPVSIILCDVDRFKEVNDVHGHDCGDAVLRDIAYDLRRRLRSFELVYRLGGEEFMVVLPGVGLTAGHATAERLRAGVQTLRPTGIPITVSCGVSAAKGAEVHYDALFKAADDALYAAKRAGRNRVFAADPSSPAHGLLRAGERRFDVEDPSGELHPEPLAAGSAGPLAG